MGPPDAKSVAAKEVRPARSELINDPAVPKNLKSHCFPLSISVLRSIFGDGPFGLVPFWLVIIVG
jgi:hypothetical protein